MKTTEQQHNERKQELMEKCFECYAENGLTGTGIKALADACGNLEVAESVGDVGCVPGVPHALQGGAAEHVETFCPEAIRPVHGVDAGVHHPGVAAPAHIRQSVALCECCRDGGGS